jgi:hypothetical protein
MRNSHPDVDKIFNDLDKYRDFCRFEGKVFDEADLYRKSSENWRAYLAYQNRVNGTRR